MINFLGSVIAFPVVPILELSIDDLINGFDMNALIERFKTQLLNIKVPFLPDPSTLGYTYFYSQSVYDFEFTNRFFFYFSNYNFRFFLF